MADIARCAKCGESKELCNSVRIVCSDCGGEIQMGTVPAHYTLLKIPFTEYTFELWDWGHEEPFCMECTLDKQLKPQRDSFDAGQEIGYEKGYNDGVRR